MVGDQLTVERAVNGHASLSNGFTPEECLDGLHFEIADWHAGNKFLQVNKSSISISTYQSLLVSVVFSFFLGGGEIFVLLAPVVQKLDSTIHRINHYPVDKF